MALTVSALAADLPKAPVYKAAPAAAYSWTGFYVGGNIGGAWDAGWDANLNPTGATAIATFPALSLGQSASGVTAGGQIGYNWQFAPNWVAGIEADLQWTNIDGGPTISPVPIPAGGSNPGFATMTRDVEWFGTVRARFGYSWDRVLTYATGGLAYGRVNYAGDVNFNVTGGQASPVAFSDTEVGWTIGGGIEWAVAGNWTIKGEYLYVSLGDGASGHACFPITGCANAGTAYNWNDTDFHVARFGINYKFGQ